MQTFSGIQFYIVLRCLVNSRIHISPLLGILSDYFDETGCFIKKDLSSLMNLITRIDGNKSVKIQESVLSLLDLYMDARQFDALSTDDLPSLTFLKTRLYDYQNVGVRYC